MAKGLPQYSCPGMHGATVSLLGPMHVDPVARPTASEDSAKVFMGRGHKKIRRKVCVLFCLDLFTKGSKR